MFNDLQYILMVNHSAADILGNIAIALLCGFFIAWIYRVTYRGQNWTIGFLSSLVLLSMITAVVIMIIGNNLARAFGLVGAMSIIRFRTAVKDTLDIVFIFFSLTVGMAAGVGYSKMAIIGTLFIGITILIISRTRITAPKRKEYLLQFLFQPNGAKNPAYQPVLEEYCRDFNIINVKSIEENEVMEMSYYIRLKSKDQSNQFLINLKASGARNISLFFDQEEF